MSRPMTAPVSVLDTSALNQLQQSAREKSPEATRAAAQQFEALFLGMVMKSMRDATPSEGLMDGEQGRMMTGMLDQQMAQALAKRGVGLADVLVRQMSVHAAPDSKPSVSRADPSAFSQQHAPHAEAASAATGIPARFLLAQAALESGWGKREIRQADGSSSHNVFGLKAGAGWEGKTAEVMTTEYVNGAPQKTVQRFRAYESYGAAFSDYASMMAHSPRYAQVLAGAADAQGFARGLQKAGYATDPRYAEKLVAVIARV